MALSSTVVWEIRTTGNAANGGGFNSAAAGTDYSQQDAAQVVIDGVTITATVNATTTILDLTGHTAVAADVGNLVRIAGGTMTAGTYQITAVNAGGGNSWTIDRSGGTAGQTGTGRMGGAQIDPALVSAVLVAGNTVHQKAGTYSITSASTNVAGGCVSNTNRLYWEGYQTTRGDLGTAPLFQASGISTATLMALTGAGTILRNVHFDGASLTSIQGAQNDGGTYDCVAMNCTNSGLLMNGSGAMVRCRATGCTTAGAGLTSTGNRGIFIACVSHDNTVTGFTLGFSNALRCIADSNTGATSDGFTAADNSRLVNCVSYGNGRDGVRLTATGGTIINHIAEANGGFGFLNSGSQVSLVLMNCATYNNTSGATSGTFQINSGSVAGSASFFTDAAGADFSLNTTIGGGASARAAGIPGVFPGTTTTGYLDIGAAQHADPAGSGGQSVSIFGG